jgi:four helix bundle protein
MTINKLEDLEVWKEARLLCKWIYILTNKYPKQEDFNLKKHLRESARGVPANIAEGYGRYFYKENLRFYGISRGCLNEVKNDLYISQDVGYIKIEIFEKFYNQENKVEMKLNGLISNVARQVKKPNK